MEFKLVYTKRAVRDIQGLAQQMKKRIKVALERFVQNPFHFSKKLTEPDIGTYRFRVGDYRIIFDIEDDEVVILRIGHRKNIYAKK